MMKLVKEANEAAGVTGGKITFNVVLLVCQLQYIYIYIYMVRIVLTRYSKPYFVSFLFYLC